MKLTKRNVKKFLGIETDAALSRHFGLTRGAAFFWPDDKEIPETHQFALLKGHPELAVKVFGAPTNKAA